MNNKVKWGIIGLGDIAHGFAQAFESQNAELAAVASRSLEKAQSFAEKYQIPNAYGSYQDLYDNDEIDIVYIATPNSHHAKHMKQVLEAGKHVFCEKAITVNKKELDDVLKIAEEKDLIVAEAMTIYHMPIYEILKQRIVDGEFGKLKLATAYFGSAKEEDPTNRFFNPNLGGGALLDIGVYALAFVQYFLQAEPDEFSTLVSLYPTGVDEMSTISYSTKDGALGNVVMSFTGNLPQQGVIVCEDAYITIDKYQSASKATIHYNDGSVETVNAGDSKLRLRYEMENITQMILTGNDYSYIDITQSVTHLMDLAIKNWQMDWAYEATN